MRVLMLGWEFPPFIAGGLGVACYGLTRALDQRGHHVTFVLPRPVDRAHASHVKVLSPGSARIQGGKARPAPDAKKIPGFELATFHEVPATFSSPYPGFDPAKWISLSEASAAGEKGAPAIGVPAANVGGQSVVAGVPAVMGAALGAPKPPMHLGSGGGAGHGYGSDLVGDAERYARLCVAIARGEDFDVIHAHDWLTYPAGLALSRVTGRPLIVHVHSTEFDRSGSNVNQRVYDIERAGMHGADRVIAVSQLTKSICVRRYGVQPAKVDVVYNGIERENQQAPQDARIESNDKIVLFLGRITMQKGPEYFIAAARRVLEKYSDVKFIVAGSGDMALRMVELAANMGIGHKVLFTGFLRGADVERVYQLADCYVMPSVSEPFGIAALEAIHHDVPVIISKTSGASEVLTHVLKVDFWDTDEMANKILAVLRHPPLSQTMREHGIIELHRLTWTGAADECVRSYEVAVHGKVQPV